MDKVEISKPESFFKRIVKDANDLYVLATALYIFIITLPIIIFELLKKETEYVEIKLYSFSIGEIPMSLHIVIVSVMLTTIVNKFRDILNSITLLIYKKLKIRTEKKPNE